MPLLITLILILPWLRSEYLCAFAGDARAYAATVIAMLMVLWQLKGSGTFFKQRLSKPPNADIKKVPDPFNCAPFNYLLPFAFLLLFITWNFASLAWTADPLATRLRLREILPWTLLVLVTAIMTAGHARKRFILAAAMAFAGSLTGAVSLGYLWLYGQGLHPSGRLQFPFDHPAALGGSLVAPCVLLAGTMVLLLMRRHFKNAFLAGCMLTPVIGALFLSQTRTCLLGAGAGLWLALVTTLKGTLRRMMLVLMLLTIIAGALFVTQTYSGNAGRTRLYTSTFGTRVLYSATALRMAMARPVTGHGAGAFCKASTEFENKDDFLHAQRGDIVLTTHSEPLQILAELGGVGLLLWLALHLASVWPALSPVSKRPQEPDGCDAPARLPDIFCVDRLLAAGLIGMFVDSCGSMSLRYNELPAFYAICLGTAMGSYELRARNYEPWIKRCLQSFLPFAFCLLLFGFFGWFVLRPTLGAERAFSRVCRNQVKGEKALELLRRARQNAGTMRTWYYASYNLARRAEAAGLTNESIRIRRQIMAHFPSGPINRQRLASLLCRTGQLREAFMVCVQGLIINPHDWRMDQWIEEVLRRCRRDDLAAWLCNTSLTACNRQYLLARHAWQHGAHEAAKNMIEKLALDQVTVDIARYRTGLWHTISGNRTRAMTLLTPEIARHPADPRALALAARLLAPPLGSKQEIARAWAMLDRAVRFGEAVPEVVRTAVDMYIAGSDYQRANQVSSRALSRNSMSPRLWVTRIICLRRMGKKAEARNTLSRALHRFPADPGLRRLRNEM